MAVKPSDQILRLSVRPEIEEAGLAKQYLKMRTGLTREMTAGMRTALKTGFKAADFKYMRQEFVRTGQALEKAWVEAAEASVAVMKKGLRDEELFKARALQKETRDRLNAVKKERSEQLKTLKIREKARETLGWGRGPRGFVQRAGAVGGAGEAFGQGVHGIYQKATSKDFGSLAELIKGGGGGVGKIGTIMQAQSSTGGLGKIMGSMGGMLTKLGPVITAVGGLAVGFAALAKIIIDADAQFKELNRTILEGGTAALDLHSKAVDLATSLDDIQSVATNLDFNRLWGTTSKDLIPILNSLSDAGVSFDEMVAGSTSAAERSDRLKESLSSVLTYSKLLGMSTSEISSAMGSYMEELGMTLSAVTDKFSALSEVAKESGFGTKRFFSMLLQATSGMTMYNVRLEEAANLMTSLGRVMNPKQAEAFVSSLTKGFGGMGTAERVKKSLLLGAGSGKGEGLRIGNMEANRQASEFMSKLMKFTEDQPDKAGSLWKSLGKRGITKGMGSQALIDRFFRMGVAQMGATQQVLSQAGTNLQGAAKQLWTISQIRAGGVGGLQASMQAFGPMATALTRLSETQLPLGKTVGDISPTDFARLIGAENLGLSPEEIGQYQTLAGLLEGILVQVGEARQEGPEAIKTLNEVLQDKYGIMIGEDRKLYKALVGKEGSFTKGALVGENLTELGLAIADKALPEKVKTDLDLAKTVAENTTEMTKILEQGVEALLKEINDAVQDIRATLSLGGLNREERQASTKGLQILKENISVARSELLDKKRAGGSPEEIQSMEQKLKVLEKAGEVYNRDLSVSDTASPESWIEGAKTRATQLMHIGSKSKLGAGKIQDIQKESEEAALDIMSSTGLSGKILTGVAKATGTGEVLEEVKSQLMPTLFEQKVLGAGAAPADDFLMRVGGNGSMQVQRIDPGDVMVGAKTGGAVSAAAGRAGGGSVNVYHMYNDGPGILSTITKAQRAGMLR
jgi:hypothetical protein